MHIDLKDGVIPISKAGSSLAQQIKRARATGKPVIVTQKGYPQGVILSVEAYEELRARARANGQRDNMAADGGQDGNEQRD